MRGTLPSAYSASLKVSSRRLEGTQKFGYVHKLHHSLTLSPSLEINKTQAVLKEVLTKEGIVYKVEENGFLCSGWYL